MSKERQSDRHIIWSNLSLNVDDWRDGYKEHIEINELDDDPNDESKLYEFILILSFLTVLDNRNIRQPLTKQSVVLSVTAMMNSF